mgnify:CR=1 FL=1
MPRHVLIPLDGTPASEHALGLLEGQADKDTLEVVLVGVWEPSEAALGSDHVLRARATPVLSCVKANLESYLAGVERRLSNQGIKVESRCLFGDPQREIPLLARQEGIDLILASPGGLSGPRCAPPPARWCHTPCPIIAA